MSGTLKTFALILVLLAGIGTPMLIWLDTTRLRAAEDAGTATDLPPLPAPMTAEPGPLTVPRKLAERARFTGTLPPLPKATGGSGESTLSGRVEGAGAGRTVHLYGRGGWRRATTDAAGAFTFAAVPSGRALLMVGTGPGQGLPATVREVELRPGPAETNRVTLTEPAPSRR